MTKQVDDASTYEAAGAARRKSSSQKDWFRLLARQISHVIGTPAAFVVAVAAVIVWACCGPIFGFSDTWQLVINTSTTIITFLVVFLIQNTQNHDARALHLKLDELIRAVEQARTSLVDLESLPDEELDQLEREFQRLRQGERDAAPDGKTDQRSPQPERSSGVLRARSYGHPRGGSTRGGERAQKGRKSAKPPHS